MAVETEDRSSAANCDAAWAATPQRAVHRALAYMHMHCGRRLPLAEVASVAHMSQFHFSRVFHRVVGVTFQDHLVRLRLRNAEHVLRHDPSAPLRRVAAQTGFGTLRNLQDHYGRVYGYPPSRGRCLAMVVEGVESAPATDQGRPNAVFPQSLYPVSYTNPGCA